jgi:UDP-glucuronate decarboxylase
MKKVLVTGAAGFLGSHLCERLLAEGCRVYAFDNLYTGSMDNIRHLMTSDMFSFHNLDVTYTNFVHLAHCLTGGNLSEIYNLACPASPVHYQKDPIYTWKTSVIGAMNVLELAEFVKKFDGVSPRIVQASTSEVYGDPLVHPQPESYFGNVNPIGIRSCYDEGKRAAESLFFDFRRTYGTDTGVFRIFNTYGPRMATDDGRVVSNFIVAGIRGEPLTIQGTGKQTRSFCYVDDLVEGILRFTRTDLEGPVNLGNPVEFTIEELASMIVSRYGVTINYVEAAQDDPKQRKPIILLAQELLNWTPNVQLKDGLDKTIEYFKEKLDVNRTTNQRL